MECALKNIFLLSLLMVHCLADDRPTMTPAGPLVEVTAGHELKIICKSTKDIKLYQPSEPDMGGIKATEAEEEKEAVGMHSWTYTMRKPKTTIGDSGFYGCANEDVVVDMTKHDQPDVTWLQVIISNI